MNEQIDRTRIESGASAIADIGAVRTRPKPRRRRLVRTLVWLVLLAVVCGAAITWWMGRAANAVSYATAAVDRGPITRAVTATGTVNPILTVTVGSYVSGVIKQVLCDYNTEVKQGQVCARIDPRPFQTALDQTKANLDVAKAQLQKDNANLTYAKLAYGRNAELAKRQAVTQDVADSAKSVQDQAQAQVALDEATIELRQAELAAAQVNLDYTDIASPVDGTVVSRNITIGQTVASSFQTPTLFLIAQDLKQMQVDTNASESDIGSVRQGDRVIFTVDAFPSRNFEGTVASVREAPQSIQNVVTYDVVVTVDNADLALRPGMTASVRIVVDERNDVIRVPTQALRYRPSNAPATPIPGAGAAGPGPAAGPQTSGQRHRPGAGGSPSQPVAGAAPVAPIDRSQAGGAGRIWLLRDGRPEPAQVTTGLDDGSFTEIMSGSVQPGDQVVTGEQTGAQGSAQAGRAPQPRLRL
jgi:HlyD family secretion protein